MQRFAALNIQARSGQKMDTAFCFAFRREVRRIFESGEAQVHVIALGDNDLREAIDARKVAGAYQQMEEMTHRLQSLINTCNETPDCHLTILTPLPSPKYHRYTDMWERSCYTMRTTAAQTRSPNTTVRNITKRYMGPVYNIRGTITGWDVIKSLFGHDGVHLSTSGVDVLIEEIVLALKVTPRFAFETDLRRVIDRVRQHKD